MTNAYSEPDLSHVHQVVESNPIIENVPDHGGRVETPAFTKAKGTLHKILAVLGGFPFYGVSAGTAVKAATPPSGSPT